MKPSEVVALVALVHEIQPAQKVSEFTPDAWHDVLAPLPATFEQAREAVARVARRSTWISPSDVYGELLRILPPQQRRTAPRALPSRFETDEERAARIRRGAALCRATLARTSPPTTEKQ